eukprot:1006570_1
MIQSLCLLNLNSLTQPTLRSDKLAVKTYYHVMLAAMSIVFVLFIVLQHSKAPFTSTQSIILCNETISNSISGGQSHYYQLNTNRFYEVNFMTCKSDIDVTVHVLDDSDSNNDISNDYCLDGDVCGSCNTENHVHENFTIPLQSASYYIQIE